MFLEGGWTMKKKKGPLFIFEMANNHQGSVEHGKTIIREIRKVCDDFPQFEFAFKFQYRDLDTFIHIDYKDRQDLKNVKRFQDTKLSQEQFGELLKEVRDNHFLAICTPFDEISVDHIAEQKYDYIFRLFTEHDELLYESTNIKDAAETIDLFLEKLKSIESVGTNEAH